MLTSRLQAQARPQKESSNPPAHSHPLPARPAQDPILRLQRTIGNQAVLRLMRAQNPEVGLVWPQQGSQAASATVQRSPGPESDQPEKTKQSPKASPSPGNQVCSGPKLGATKLTADSTIDKKVAGVIDDVMARAAACGTLKTYITAKGDLAQGHLKVIEHYRGNDVVGSTHAEDRFDADDFHQAVKKYLQETEPDFPTDEEKQRQKIAEIGGFYDRKRDTINLPSDAKLGSALHEAVHRTSKPVFKNYFGQFLNEGVTQMFSDMILQDESLSAFTGHNYGENLKVANRLKDDKMKGNWKPIAEIYFNGDIHKPWEIMASIGLNRAMHKEQEILDAIKK